MHISSLWNRFSLWHLLLSSLCHIYNYQSEVNAAQCARLGMLLQRKCSILRCQIHFRHWPCNCCFAFIWIKHSREVFYNLSPKKLIKKIFVEFRLPPNLLWSFHSMLPHLLWQDLKVNYINYPSYMLLRILSFVFRYVRNVNLLLHTVLHNAYFTSVPL
jgi:hypothetical protein